jgi:hypothetical protein
MPGIPTCRRCGDVIGAYEPMVVLADGLARSTSRAAEPKGERLIGECYHAACYEQAHAPADRPTVGWHPNT